MIYWLFTDGRELLSSLLIPLSCLTLLMPLIVSAVFGAGIQRSSEIQSISGWKRGLKLFTHGIVLLGITTIYLSLASNFAIETVRGRQSTNAFIRTLTGGPDNIDHLRLFGFGVMLLFMWVVVSIGLHSGLKNGGWLRERVDRLRTPQVRRGALGSSHFCSQREYKRFRREDPEGLTLLGAFWGESKRRLDLGTGRFCLGGEDKFGSVFQRVVYGTKIDVLLTPYRSPQANAVCERFWGSLRRECLDFFILIGERHLHQVVKQYMRYHNHSRPHQGIDQEIPCGQEPSVAEGQVIAFPVLGGLHHDYRYAA